ncbi:MAG: hypothetical protein QOJ07_3910, partial [Thermoleophilaceae bacterium]|nr:hypothetical protein [Thermoleophilaceae bacterium]
TPAITAAATTTAVRAAGATMTDPGHAPRSDPDAPTAKLPAVPCEAAKRPPAAPRRERIRKPGPLPVIAGSFGLFFAITALLAFQVRRGADPALGEPKPRVLAAAPTPHRVLVRRVIVTRIVEHRPRRAASPPAAAPTALAGTARSAPVGTAPSVPAAPRTAPSSPAPAPAAPPAPAPAPLTTRSS